MYVEICRANGFANPFHSIELNLTTFFAIYFLGSNIRRNFNLSQVEQGLRIMVMLKYLFGTKSGGMVVLVIIGFIALCGYIGINTLNDPSSKLIKIDQLYEVDQVEAVKQYKAILKKRNFFDKSQPLVVDGRHKLYRRIIAFEAMYGDPAEGRDWILEAWHENIRTLTFQSQEPKELWQSVMDELKSGKPSSDIPTMNF